MTNVIIIIIIIIITMQEILQPSRVDHVVTSTNCILQMRRGRRRWEDNIKMDLQEIGVGCGEWIELAQDNDRWRALVSRVKNLRVP
jgi:hypothetical protein